MTVRTWSFLFIAMSIGAGTLYGLYHVQWTRTQKPQKIEHALRHLAIIMDGNRRWARSHKLAAWQGHKRGTKPVKEAVKFCLNQDIPYLTLYTFSLENFKRPQKEQEQLFATIEEGLAEDELHDLLQQGVRIRSIGNTHQLPPKTRKAIERITEQTKNGNRLTVNLLLCYGGRQEITSAVRDISHKVAHGTLQPKDIDDTLITNHLWTSDMPDPDFVVRTGGKQRLSNFLPWQTTYSELLFVDTYWPDIQQDDLLNALKTFNERTRNFGK